MEYLMTSVPTNLSSICSTIRTLTHTNIKKLSNASSKFTEQLRRLNLGYELDTWISVEGLCCLTLIIVLICCTLVILLKIYRKIRYSIPATVNCWFCNNNAKVLYPLRDTWTCPKCHQYNGFTADGNYNKRIPAQFIEALNRPVRGGPVPGYLPKQSGSNSNGLCSQCNLNQVLKVFQLASFVPVHEKNYATEIEAEQKRLEQLYEICSQCKRVVEDVLKKTPDGKQLPIKRKVRVNKVVPSPPDVLKPKPRPGNKNAKDAISAFLEYQKEVLDDSDAESENSSGESFLSLDNLQINAEERNEFGSFHVPLTSAPPRFYDSHVPSSGRCSASMHSKNFGSTFLTKEAHMPPLWKDYPMVQSGFSPTYSVLDTMSCPPVGRAATPMPAYVSYNNPVIMTPSHAPQPHHQFNYQSSNIGSVFGGGRKPVLSPPKFSVNNAHFAPYVRYGAYYDIGGAPMMFNSQFFNNPISRSSSQSSGFVSQQGGINAQQPQHSTMTCFMGKDSSFSIN